ETSSTLAALTLAAAASTTVGKLRHSIIPSASDMMFKLLVVYHYLQQIKFEQEITEQTEKYDISVLSVSSCSKNHALSLAILNSLCFLSLFLCLASDAFYCGHRRAIADVDVALFAAQVQTTKAAECADLQQVHVRSFLG